MSNVSYQWLPGPVGDMLRRVPYATTSKIALSPTTSLIVTTGHIGLDVQTGDLVNDTLEHEFEAIFNCLDAALKNAGAQDGLRSAFKFVSYLTEADFEPIMQQAFRARWPGHTPTWTTVVVKAVAGPGTMHAEIATEAVVFS